MNFDLPKEYIEYLESEKPKSGFTDLDFAGYFDLEPFEKIEQLNSDIKINAYAPGFLAFAGNGGGEVLAFDSMGQVYSIPLIGMSPKDAILIAKSWNEFASHIEESV